MTKAKTSSIKKLRKRARKLTKKARKLTQRAAAIAEQRATAKKGKGKKARHAAA
jgi:prefoldin subunit 5